MMYYLNLRLVSRSLKILTYLGISIDDIVIIFYNRSIGIKAEWFKVDDFEYILDFTIDHAGENIDTFVIF